MSAKRKREAAIKDWKWLLWDSAFATEYLHQKLGAGWTAVLKEACCVNKDKDKDKVNRLREEGDSGPLRLWPRIVNRYGSNVTKPFPDMVVTVPFLEWCVRRKYKPSARTFEATARGGNMDAIRWLREHKCPWYEGHWANACTGAVRGGHLDVLQWLREEGCPWDEWTCEAAAEGGHLNVLQWIREHGLTWDSQTCAGAAYGGHLNILKLLRENGCPWDVWTCLKAAKGGHLDVLKYAHENGCKWSSYVCLQACCRGHLDMLKYARAHGCPWHQVCYLLAQYSGHPEVADWALDNGCTRGFTSRSEFHEWFELYSYEYFEEEEREKLNWNDEYEEGRGLLFELDSILGFT